MLRTPLKIIALIFVSLILIFPNLSYSEPTSFGIEKGEKAPYSGVLLNEEAVAKIISDKEYQEKKCSLDLQKTEDLMDAECSIHIDDLNLSLEIQRKEWELIVSAKDDEISSLKTVVGELSSGNEIWWFVGGVGAGAVVAGAIAIIAIYAGN